MIDTKQRVRAALEGAGVYLRPHQGDEYVGEVAMAVAVIYKHLSSLDTQGLQTWDISVLELASIYGRAEDMARFTPDPKPAPPKLVKLDDSEAPGDLLKIVHATIKKVGEDVEKLRFNTAISQMMECTNAFTAAEKVPHQLFHTLLILLNPFAPHLSEELWERLGYEGSCLEAPWPSHNESLLVEDEIEMVVQVNGKVRSRIRLTADASREATESAARDDPKVQAHLEGLTVRKVIVVPGRLVNLVAG